MVLGDITNLQNATPLNLNDKIHQQGPSPKPICHSPIRKLSSPDFSPSFTPESKLGSACRDKVEQADTWGPLSGRVLPSPGSAISRTSSVPVFTPSYEFLAGTGRGLLATSPSNLSVSSRPSLLLTLQASARTLSEAPANTRRFSCSVGPGQGFKNRTENREAVLEAETIKPHSHCQQQLPY